MAVTPASAASRSAASVTARREAAEVLGRRVATLVADTDAVATELRVGLEALADPSYVAGQQRVAPGIGPIIGVRWPLIAAVARGFRRETANDRPSTLLYVVDRLFREEALELRWFAFDILEQTVERDPERTWQLLRRAARDAGDWVTVDALAHPYGRGILLERYRWAELEQLVFSPSRWERRLVGSTIATMPHVRGGAAGAAEIVLKGLPLLRELIGDAEPDVQRAMAWAYRTLARLDRDVTTEALRAEAETAVASGDGHRAWVVREALRKLDPAVAAELKAQLAGVRRRSTSPATSRAAEIAGRFGDLPLGRRTADPPLT
jgi:3-methyladenine DNA glycosylase AlkD